MFLKGVFLQLYFQDMRKVALVILDGWGLGDHSHADAVFQAQTPCMDYLMRHYPNTQLKTSGLDVGLPDGQMGNSEVGHLNIGAGRIVYQDLTRISKSIQEGTLAQNKVLNNTFQYCLNKNKPLHLMGLLSEGGVHSHEKHLYELVRLAEQAGLFEIYIHAFLDGRDTDPKSGHASLQRLDHFLKNRKAKVSTIIGRYYAMDRDKRWERVQKAYDLLIHGKGVYSDDYVSAVNAFYQKQITDEFMEPIRCLPNSHGLIQEHDAVLCFNFRTDRCREITQALTQQSFLDYSMHPIPLCYVTMTRYDERFQNVQVLFEKDDLNNTLGEVLSKYNKTQLRAAETEKYPHVTFFFSGGRELAFEGEQRILVASPKVATYDLQPTMSAPELTQKVIQHIQSETPDFVCLNFANPDMVGHTGVYDAILQAIETVDACLDQVVKVCVKLGYTLIVIADHGNADVAINLDGSPNTAHSTNPVPLVAVNAPYKNLKPGILADVAPSILNLMNIPVPPEMTGTNLMS